MAKNCNDRGATTLSLRKHKLTDSVNVVDVMSGDVLVAQIFPDETDSGEPKIRIITEADVVETTPPEYEEVREVFRAFTGRSPKAREFVFSGDRSSGVLEGEAA